MQAWDGNSAQQRLSDGLKVVENESALLDQSQVEELENLTVPLWRFFGGLHSAMWEIYQYTSRGGRWKNTYEVAPYSPSRKWSNSSPNDQFVQIPIQLLASLLTLADELEPDHWDIFHQVSVNS